MKIVSKTSKKRAIFYKSSVFFDKLWSRDKTPVSILLLAVVIGFLGGVVVTLFELAIHTLSQSRTDWLDSNISSMIPLGLLAFIISAGLALMGYWLVHRFAPEAAGSGIPEVEGAMEGIRPTRWWRVIPVKFFGGLGALGSGMILGREGPSVQIGANIGRMVTDTFRIKDRNSNQTLLASGAAAGLAAAFNAPLAAIMFVVEEMRPQFRYTLISIKAVIIAAIMADIVFRYINGQEAVIVLPQYETPPLASLWFFLALGCCFGVFGVLFNFLIMRFQDFFQRFYQKSQKRIWLVGATLGGFFGLLLVYAPELTHGGINLVPDFVSLNYSINALLFIFMARTLLTVICFSSGAPGGIFAPMLALGTLLGTVYGLVVTSIYPEMGIEPGMFAIAGMGALFAATVRAPITGILLVIEMTNNYYLILPLIITTLGATLVAQLLGGQPIYTELLRRKVREQKLRVEKSAES